VWQWPCANPAAGVGPAEAAEEVVAAAGLVAEEVRIEIRIMCLHKNRPVTAHSKLR
jgi:hypothetical protein